MSDQNIIHLMLEETPDYRDLDAMTLASMIADFVFGWRIAEDMDTELPIAA